MEQTLGHVTHHLNLKHWVEEDPEISANWMPITPLGNDIWQRIPVIKGNWSLKASLRARDSLRKIARTETLDALFMHTQTLTLFALETMRHTPSIISLDATPLNYDTVGAEYGHNPGKQSWIEHQKKAWYISAFRQARMLITWCQWAKDSLVQDYKVPAEKVSVVPPGVDMEQWQFGGEKRRSSAENSQKLRLLFVGGDFLRKGGKILCEAMSNGLGKECELDIVTRDDCALELTAGLQNVRVHQGLTANSLALKDLYSQADIFVFPTLGDCLPIAVMEAMAAGLPVITTGVGALKEEVEDGVNGLIVPPRDVRALSTAVQALLRDPVRRNSMSYAGREIAENRFDARRNYGEIISLMKTISHS